ncbi:TPA: hypothetical protein DIV45_02715 [Patescibacteria group bacterium]|nr:hypothetical protein [Patescibacteria group bacterium]
MTDVREKLDQPLLVGYDPCDPTTWSPDLSPEDVVAFTTICRSKTLWLLHIVRRHVQLENTYFGGGSDKQNLVQFGQIIEARLAKKPVYSARELGELIDECSHRAYVGVGGRIRSKSILLPEYEQLLQQLFDFICSGKKFEYQVVNPTVRQM